MPAFRIETPSELWQSDRGLAAYTAHAITFTAGPPQRIAVFTPFDRSRCASHWFVELAGLPSELVAELVREDDVEGQRARPTSEFFDPGVRRLRALREEMREEQWSWIETEGVSPSRQGEIWRDDGERVQDLIQRQDFHQWKTLEGFYSAKVRYER
ncbi:uncharacterized protein BXZ73DRAFT_80306 [Epithele typhae]|uniref:uncharacterized protein n=1 Tax=Epithele typhae TaxID=378194 RepID=UPI002007EA28|nr:uncharacterized protein BXZ73DRAFT_80306 [Epithele typhae]KAH9919792.1 hypothetical protein BXZ73DRAFT_80306 [Epithele typhae]